MKTTPLCIITLIAVIGFSFFACANPNSGGNEHEHTWGAPAVGNQYDGETVWGDWVEMWAAELDMLGSARRIATVEEKQDSVYTCQDCGLTKTETNVLGVRTWRPEEPFVNLDLVENKPLEWGKTVVNGEIVDGYSEAEVWQDVGDPIVKNGDEIGDDIIIVDKNDNAIPINSGYEYTYIKQIKTGDKDGRTERYLLIKEELIELGVNLPNDRDPGVTDTDEIDLLDMLSDYGRNYVGDLSEGAIRNAIEGEDRLLSRLSKQAARLEEFFEYSSDHFDVLQAAEGAIKNKVEQTTMAGYLDSVKDGEEALFNLIGENINGTSEFNTLWNGYKAGYYIVARDWQTIGGVSNVDVAKLAQYRAAANRFGYEDIPVDHRAGVIQMPSIGSLPVIEAELVDKGTAAFKTANNINDSTQDAQIRAMIEALIIQFGQDNVEFEAFYHDVEIVNPLLANETYEVDPLL